MSPYSSHQNAAPINPLPPVVAALSVLIVGIEMILQLGDRQLIGGATSVGWRLEALNGWAFSPVLFDRMVETGSFPLRQMARFVTYSFVHLGFSHVLFVVVFLLALGKLVGEIFSAVALLAVFFGSAIMGALIYALVLDDPVALIGGYPAVYGLIGAYTFVMWTGLGVTGENQYRAFTLIGALLAIQLIFGLLFGGGLGWVAELAGFLTGFALSFAVSPGGWGQVMAKLRRR